MRTAEEIRNSTESPDCNCQEEYEERCHFCIDAMIETAQRETLEAVARVSRRAVERAVDELAERIGIRDLGPT